MEINPLNLQLSVPRAPELSNLQQQLNNRPVTEQNILESMVVKETEEKRTQTAAVDKAEKGIIRDEEKEPEGESSEPNDKKKRKKKQELQEHEGIQHPFKGHKLDIRL